MPIRMNKPGESSFGINIDDTFDPTEDHTVELVDMDEFNGVSKLDGKPYVSIVWKFRIFDADGVAFTNLIDGGPYESWQFSSLSLAEKSTGRAWAAALVGHPLTDAECDALADRFDEALVGKRALASWKVEEDAKGKKLKIALLRPERKKAAPKAETVAAPPAPTPITNGPARESAAQRRARLEAELAAVADEDADGNEVPF
jgi:hypothetical protein